jgi:hypothetical protein
MAVRFKFQNGICGAEEGEVPEGEDRRHGRSYEAAEAEDGEDSVTSMYRSGIDTIPLPSYRLEPIGVGVNSLCCGTTVRISNWRWMVDDSVRAP